MSQSASARFKPSDGDWICGDAQCGNVNFARRTECNKCGQVRKDGTLFKKGGVEIGKNMAEKSKGLFSADDWQCKGCGNVNWARRMTCNMCNQPKYGRNEARTGYGGGYMERDEVVEYKDKDHSDSDDAEVDDYGRRKKKFRGSSTEMKTDLDKKPAEKGDEVEEEEEDDDDEDVDMSKYKLESDEEDDDDVDLSKYNLSESDSEKDKKPEDTKPAAADADKRETSSRSSSSSSSSSSNSRSSDSKDSQSHSESRSRERKRRDRDQSPRSRSRSRSTSRSREHGHGEDKYKSRRRSRSRS